MIDVDTLLTTLYVMVDDFTKRHMPEWWRPGPDGALSRSEVVTLAIFGQWSKFTSERDYYSLAIVGPRSTFGPPSRPCPIEASSIGRCGSNAKPSRALPCLSPKP